MKKREKVKLSFFIMMITVQPFWSLVGPSTIFVVLTLLFLLVFLSLSHS